MHHRLASEFDCVWKVSIAQPRIIFLYLDNSLRFMKSTDFTSQHDNESVICDDATCTKYFTYFTRKHHCRRCGNVFCHQHSSHLIPLDQDANYHPSGSWERSCEHCHKDFQRWKDARSSRSNSSSSNTEEPVTPTVNCTRVKGSLGSVFGQKGGMAESLGASVPRDWNWSTF
jgi:hypothetical protein